MPREIDVRSRLTPMESLMWRLESDRSLSATFGTVTFLDRDPDADRFRERMHAAVAALPRLGQRIDTSGLPGTSASWVDEASFDLDDHLRWQSCPGSGTEQDVLELVTELVATPFDPDRSPWEFVVVTGIAGGRAALIQRMHHAITDGKGGIRLSEQFIDIERDPPRRTPDPFVGDDDIVEPPTWLERAVMTAADRTSDLVQATTGIARWAAGGLNDPGRFGALGADVIETAQSLRRQLAVVEPAHSPLWTSRSGSRALAVGSVPFEPVRAAATKAGVSINDLFVTATLRGAAAYHRAFDRPVADLRVAIPVSVRRDNSTGGNAFSPTRVVLPSGEGLAASAHVRSVAEVLGRTKTERATSLIEPLAAAAEFVPAPLLRGAVSRQAATIDFTASNLRAAPVPLYIGGALIDATYALGPLAATAANITMMSYNGRIDLGVHVDTGAVSQPDLLRDNLVAAFHEVCEGAAALA